MNEAISLLKQLINIDSTYKKEIKLGNFLYKLLKNNGFEVKKTYVDKSRFNVIAKIGNPKIYLQAHMDTVYPFIPFSEDGKYIYGRGSCDTKGSIAAMISAALSARNNDVKDFGLIFTTDEETTFDGAKKIVKDKLKIPFVVVGEPTSLKIINSHYGIIAFKITAKGKAAHSSKPKEGVNALELLLKVVNKISNLKIHKESILTLGQITGGIADNIIPADAMAVYSMRLSPNDKTDYIKKIKSMLVDNTYLQAVINVASVKSRLNPNFPNISKPFTVKYFTELSFFKNGVVLGPGDIAFAHGLNEKVLKKEVIRAGDIYLRILKSFCKD